MLIDSHDLQPLTSGYCDWLEGQELLTHIKVQCVEFSDT